MGEHDFRNFCKMDVVNVHSYRRRVMWCARGRAPRARDSHPPLCWFCLWHASQSPRLPHGECESGGCCGVPLLSPRRTVFQPEGGQAAAAAGASGEADDVPLWSFNIRGKAFLWHQARRGYPVLRSRDFVP